ncbi:MAG: hypothetical protein JW996_01505 [Candidatus Cloacimonetes bacterium]|nr:hypothetical protein [Candidatus Cloacimonadota bacterium]
MGTQQILLIVLSVIIVGIAVAVGITMFNQQAFNSNRNACIADLNNFASQAMAFYKTPTSHGGHGNAATAPNEANLIEWIGFTDGTTGTNDFKTGNGEYEITTINATTLVISADGNEDGVDPVLTLTWATGVTTLDLSAASS